MCVEVVSYPTNTEEGSIRHYCGRKGCDYHYFEAVPVLELDEEQMFRDIVDSLTEEQERIFTQVVSYDRELTDYYNKVFAGIKPIVMCVSEPTYPDPLEPIIIVS